MLIRPLLRHKEYREAESLQKEVWEFEDREIIPSNELITAQRNGGLVLGAFKGSRLIGFCFGMTGYKDGKVYHCSRMLAVLPDYRDRGVGLMLKLAQRRFVLKAGLDLIKWTFDPLQSKNGYFNLRKLGVVVREYVVNLYGESTSKFNLGFQTDRFVPEWWIKTDHVKERIKGRLKDDPKRLLLSKDIFIANLAKVDKRGILLPEPQKASSLKPMIGIEIPADIDSLKERFPWVAKLWREKTRKLFLYYFSRGYLLCDFARKGDRSFYILRRNFKFR
jgi:predicted GNAT superfamily acetyltransferase